MGEKRGRDTMGTDMKLQDFLYRGFLLADRREVTSAHSKILLSVRDQPKSVTRQWDKYNSRARRSS